MNSPLEINKVEPYILSSVALNGYFNFPTSSQISE